MLQEHHDLQSSLFLTILNFIINSDIQSVKKFNLGSKYGFFGPTDQSAGAQLLTRFFDQFSWPVLLAQIGSISDVFSEFTQNDLLETAFLQPEMKVKILQALVSILLECAEIKEFFSVNEYENDDGYCRKCREYGGEFILCDTCSGLG